MEKIPTADEFLEKNIDYVLAKDCKDDVEQAMIEFAKLHVEQALKEAHKNAKVTSTGHPQYNKVVTRHSILNSYPLNKIK